MMHDVLLFVIKIVLKVQKRKNKTNHQWCIMKQEMNISFWDQKVFTVGGINICRKQHIMGGDVQYLTL